MPAALPASERALIEGAAVSKVERATAQLYDHLAAKNSRLAQLLATTQRVVESAQRVHATVVPHLSEHAMQPYAEHAGVAVRALSLSVRCFFSLRLFGAHATPLFSLFILLTAVSVIFVLQAKDLIGGGASSGDAAKQLIRGMITHGTGSAH